MEKPVIAERTPAVVDLDPGLYYWCRCGRSKSQPFCDGSHHGTGMEPLEFKIENKTRWALCRCKQTKTPPRCDGSHRRLPPE